MANHPNRTRWQRVSYGARENPGCFDTGNGAIAVITESPRYPGLERVTITYYAKGRGPNYVYYRRAEDASGAFVRGGAPSWDTLSEALKACT